MDDIELNAEERNAIAALKRLSKRWPRTLWLFAGGSGSESLTVLRTGANGERVRFPGNGCIDQGYVVGEAPFPSDGGDW